jgi:hypothetical protein
VAARRNNSEISEYTRQ